MKAHTLLVVTVMCWLTHAQSWAAEPPQWGPITNNLQMSIALADNRTNITVGEDFALTIRFRNLSTNKMITVYQVNGTIYDPTYSFEIISPSGRDVSPDTKKLKPGDSGVVLFLVPHQIVDIRFDLGQLCKLGETGTYNIVARKTLWSPTIRTTITVTSNPLSVRVVPDS